MCTFVRPSCVQTTRLTNESEVSSLSNRRIGAYVMERCSGGLGDQGAEEASWGHEDIVTSVLKAVSPV